MMPKLPPARSRPALPGLHADVSETEFCDAIERIHSYLESGDTYQVNYTYRLNFDAYGSVAGLYRRLRARQAVPYGALIALPDGRAVLSSSPELFIRHQRGELIARPMKGTAAASGDAEIDRARAAELAADAKNRAENLMIVDLLRNDIGRVATVGSVRVPHSVRGEFVRPGAADDFHGDRAFAARRQPGGPVRRAVSMRLHHRRAEAPHDADYPRAGSHSARHLHRCDRLV